MRIWAAAAVCGAILLALRGAFQLAFACLLLSPIPELIVARFGPDRDRPSFAWVTFVGVGVVLLAVLFVAVVYVGGIPPVHEWRAALRGTV
jgi:hypothetical protein